MNEKKPQPTAEEIGCWMEQNDRFARMLGVQLDEVGEGYAKASMVVTEDMQNAVGITQGGATFTLADFAYGVASNSHATVAVSLNAQMSYTRPSKVGERLVATAKEISKTRRTGLYQVEVHNGEGQLIAQFTGNVFRCKDVLSDWMK